METRRKDDEEPRSTRHCHDLVGNGLAAVARHQTRAAEVIEVEVAPPAHLGRTPGRQQPPPTYT
jgi:hypothetical protein